MRTMMHGRSSFRLADLVVGNGVWRRDGWRGRSATAAGYAASWAVSLGDTVPPPIQPPAEDDPDRTPPIEEPPAPIPVPPDPGPPPMQLRQG